MRPPSAVSRTELAAAAATKPQLPAYGELQVRVGPAGPPGPGPTAFPGPRDAGPQGSRGPRPQGLGALARGQTSPILTVFAPSSNKR